MDSNLLFWTAALSNMGMVVVLAAAGVRMRRRNQISRHRRLMQAGSVLVILFLPSYFAKLHFLGRENMDVWSSGAVWVLRFHEVFVLLMLLFGFLALRRGLALARTGNATLDPSDPPAAPERARGHRLAGWMAVGTAVAGLLTACLVLLGMNQRAGLG